MVIIVGSQVPRALTLAEAMAVQVALASVESITVTVGPRAVDDLSG